MEGFSLVARFVLIVFFICYSVCIAWKIVTSTYILKRTFATDRDHSLLINNSKLIKFNQRRKRKGGNIFAPDVFIVCLEISNCTSLLCCLPKVVAIRDFSGSTYAQLVPISLFRVSQWVSI